MPRYATQTTVSPEKSLAEIKSTLRRYGADQFAFAESGGEVMIGFRLQGHIIRLNLHLPPASDFARTPTGLNRDRKARDQAWAQAVRSRWRSLFLLVKAKLESIDMGLETVQQAWLPYLLLPSGETVNDWLLPQLAAERERMPSRITFALNPASDT